MMSHVWQIISTIIILFIILNTIYITLKSKYFHKSRYLLQTEDKTDECSWTLYLPRISTEFSLSMQTLVMDLR